MVSAPSRSARKMPSIESSIGPMTKQLNRLTRRPLPEPAWMRPPGRNWKSRNSAAKRARHATRLVGSARATVAAIRAQVSSIDASCAGSR
jgi:hypothetical protein